MELRFIREKECQHLTGLSKGSRYRLEKLGKFPIRKRISESITGWLHSEIEEWIKERAAEKYVPNSEIGEHIWKRNKNAK